MESKPYSIQSPEQIAKDYGGNKQKIAEAMRLGVVDPTAGTLAGMFIDRMRSAQMQEQAPPADGSSAGLCSPAPPAPMGGGAPMGAPPMGPPAGLGATPEAAQMAQQMPPMQAPPPEMPMEEAPVGMAAGGLTTLPIPDTMFDEPDNGGYAGGGIIAFARGGTGGMSNLYDDVEYWESGGDQGAVSGAGARGVMQLMPGTMRDPGFGVKPMQADTEEENRRVGREYLDAMYRRYGDQATALAAYNWGPGNVDKWLRSGADPKKLPSETKSYISNVMKGDEPPVRERNINTTQGLTSSLGDISDLIDRRFAKTEEEQAADDALRARAKELASPEYEDKQRKDSLWETLATIGFNMASSKSPYLLQAIGDAASAALPGAIADKKERKQLKDRALKLMVELGAKDRKDAMEKFNMATDVWKTDILQKQFGQKLDLDKEQLALARDKLDAEIAAAKQKGLSVNETVFSMYMSKDPAMKEAAEEWIRINNPPSQSAGTLTADQIRANVQAGRTGGTAEGATAKDSDGKTIVFSNGQWMYP